MAWTNPIIDRTAEDVTYALNNQSSATPLKGAWNISDANRIIDNTIYLRDTLASYGIEITLTPQSHVSQSDLPYITSFMKVLRDNIMALRTGFYELDNPVISYSDVFTYVEANNLEINLSILNTLLENMITEFKSTGSFIVGEETFLGGEI